MTQAALGADEMVIQLAGQFRMKSIGMQELNRLEADFDVVPFVEATTRLCVCFRQPDEDGALLFVIADPLDIRTRGSVEHRM
ncbi:type II/IV secretion system protein, partial [Burkholderia sp. SIMBA_019]